MAETEPRPPDDPIVDEPLPLGEDEEAAEPAVLEREVQLRVHEKGEEEARRRVAHTIRRNALAALPSTAITATLAGLILSQGSISWLEGADFGTATRLVVHYLLAMTLVEHTRSAAEDAASPTFSTGTPFDPAALPRSMMVAIPVAGMLGVPLLIAARTLETPALAVLTVPIALVLCVVGPAVSALLLVGEGLAAFRPRHLAEVVVELGGLYWDGVRFFVVGLLGALALVWGVDERGWLRGICGVLAMALAGAAVGTLARAVGGEDLIDPDERRRRDVGARQAID